MKVFFINNPFCLSAVLIVLVSLMLLDATSSMHALANTGHESVQLLQSPDSNKTSEAVFLPADSKKAVILITEWLAAKESFNQFAQVLHEQDYVVLTVDGDAITEATNFLLTKGVEEINLLGTGFGGEVILHALQKPVKKEIKRAIVISPYEAVPVENHHIKKLFITSKKDWQVPIDEVVEAYKKSSEPKRLKLYPGSAHGQGFFKSKHRKEFVDLILNFFKN